MSPSIMTLSDKQTALEALQKMPESATLEEISEEFAILAAIRRGKKDVIADRVITQEDAVRRSKEWIQK